MSLAEKFKKVDQQLIDVGTAPVPVDQRLAFQLMNKATAAQAAAVGFEAKQETGTQLLRDAMESAHRIHLETAINLGFFTFKDRSFLIFDGETNSSLATSCFNDKAKDEIHQWLLKQGIDLTDHW